MVAMKPPASGKPYAPRGGSRELMACRDTEVLLEGPAGTGKSRGVLEKGYLACVNYPGARVLLVRKTRESMSESVLVTFEEKVVPTGSKMLEGPQRRFRSVYTFSNGSTIVVGGMDKPGKIMSTEFDLILAFEANELYEDDWEKLLTRLRNGVVPYQQAIADTNPDADTHWLNQRASRGGMTRLISRHQDNPVLFDDEGNRTTKGKIYLATLDRLTGVRRHRLLEGNWASAEGMVWQEWDAKIHLIDRFEIPQSWRRFRVIDFGFTNPFVCQWWAVDEDGRAYMYREIYKTRTLVSDHAEQITRLSEGENIERTVSDHDAEDRETLRRAGIDTVAANKAVRPGLEAVSQRLRVEDDGRPRLFILRDSLVERDDALVDAKRPVCTEQEIAGYVYPKSKDGKPVKEDPVKENDHGCDAMRYLVVDLDGLGHQEIAIGGSDRYDDELEDDWGDDVWK